MRESVAFTANVTPAFVIAIRVLGPMHQPSFRCALPGVTVFLLPLFHIFVLGRAADLAMAIPVG